jgi:predicted amidophosphoribosyltransferase
MDKRQTRRMSREHKTMEAMIGIYCRGRHGTAENRLCSECKALVAYAHQRLDRCPFQENKTTCANCPVHCYNPDIREKVRGVMRYAGPRMAYVHPFLALLHFVDGHRKNQQHLSRP